jgi:hypothetical protein
MKSAFNFPRFVHVRFAYFVAISLRLPKQEQGSWRELTDRWVRQLPHPAWGYGALGRRRKHVQFENLDRLKCSLRQALSPKVHFSMHVECVHLWIAC